MQTLVVLSCFCLGTDGIRLLPISEVHPAYRNVFPYDRFNSVQSLCFDTIYRSDSNAVVAGMHICTRSLYRLTSCLSLPIIYHCRCLLSTSRRGLIDIGFILVDWRCLRIDYYEVRKLVHLFLFDCSSIHRVYSLSIINIPINSTDILWKNNAV